MYQICSEECFLNIVKLLGLWQKNTYLLNNQIPSPDLKRELKPGKERDATVDFVHLSWLMLGSSKDKCVGL